jgi:hypothetical protein
VADVLVVPPIFRPDVVEMPSAEHVARLEELNRGRVAASAAREFASGGISLVGMRWPPFARPRAG